MINSKNLSHIDGGAIKAGTACLTVVENGQSRTFPVLSKDMLKVVDGKVYSDVVEDSIMPRTPCAIVTQGDRSIMLPLFWFSFFNKTVQHDTLWVWGSGVGKRTPTKVNDKAWKSVALGGYSVADSLAIDSEGVLYGLNSSGGVYALDDVVNQHTWVCADETMAGNFACINSSGVLYEFSSGNGLGIVEEASSHMLSQVAAGYDFYLAIDTDGYLWAWGNNHYGQLGLGADSGTHQPTPTKVGNKRWSQVVTSGFNCCGIDTDGYLHVWGGCAPGFGPQNVNIYAPLQLNDRRWVQVSISNLNPAGSTLISYMMAIDEYGYLWACGENIAGQFGIPDFHGGWQGELLMVGDKKWSQVAAGSGTRPCTIAIDEDGYLWGCGANDSYLLGDNGYVTGAVDEFQQIGSAKFKKVFASQSHAAAISI